jgi:hypothetical protein
MALAAGQEGGVNLRLVEELLAHALGVERRRAGVLRVVRIE